MLKRIKINLLQKPFMTIAYFVMFIIILSFFVFGLLFFRATEVLSKNSIAQLDSLIGINVNPSYLDDIMEEIGVSSLDELSYEEYYNMFDEYLFDEIYEIDSIIGIETITTHNFYPINFTNSSKFQGENPYEQEQMTFSDKDLDLLSSGVSGISSIDISIYNYFRKNHNILIDGTFPTTENRGCLISEDLATLNSLSVGDEIELKAMSVVNNQDDYIPEVELSEDSTSIKIVGIYSTSLSFLVTELNYDSSAIMPLSPYNQIFFDYITMCEAMSKQNELIYMYTYVDSPKEIELTLEELEKLSSTQSKYTITDFSYTYENSLLELVDNFSFSVNSLLWVSILGGIAFVVLILLITDTARDNGVLLCLGEKRRNIFIQKITEFIIVIGISLVVSVFIGYITALIMAEPLTPKLEEANPDEVYVEMIFDLGLKDFVPKLVIELQPLDIVLSVLYGVLIMCVTAVIFYFKTFFYKIKTFIKKEE